MTRDDRTVPIRLHAQERSRANGPGLRHVIWFQGCDLACPGCFNPDTHAPGGGQITVESVAEIIGSMQSEIEGVSLSGGEPFQQPQALLALVRLLRAETNLSILSFSGYTIGEIRQQELGNAILEHLDVLIDGRYIAPQRQAIELRGSANQNVHLLTARYSHADIAATPPTEVRISADGLVTLTGVNPLILK